MNNDLILKKSIEINTDKKTVWDALTNPEKIKVYLFGTETVTTWEKGSPIIFQGEYQGQHYKDKGIILEFKKEQELKYSYWSGYSGLEDKPENYSTVNFSLEGSGQKTNLSLTQVGFKNEEGLEHTSSSWEQVMKVIREICEK